VEDGLLSQAGLGGDNDVPLAQRLHTVAFT
jgi:hypothetical protein